MRSIFSVQVAALSVLSVILSANPADARCNDGLNRRIRVINDSSLTISRFYASRASTTSWEEDVLGGDVIRSGRSQRFNLDDGTCRCIFDLLAVMSSGERTTRYGINICKISTWTISD